MPLDVRSQRSLIAVFEHDPQRGAKKRPGLQLDNVFFRPGNNAVPKGLYFGELRCAPELVSDLLAHVDLLEHDCWCGGAFPHDAGSATTDYVASCFNQSRNQVDVPSISVFPNNH